MNSISLEFIVDLLGDVLSLVGVEAEHDDSGAPPRQLLGGLVAHARVAARHQGSFSIQPTFGLKTIRFSHMVLMKCNTTMLTYLDGNSPLAVPPGEVGDCDAEGENVEKDQEGVGDDGEDRLYVVGIC